MLEFKKPEDFSSVHEVYKYRRELEDEINRIHGLITILDFGRWEWKCVTLGKGVKSLLKYLEGENNDNF